MLKGPVPAGRKGIPVVDDLISLESFFLFISHGGVCLRKFIIEKGKFVSNHAVISGPCVDETNRLSAIRRQDT